MSPRTMEGMTSPSDGSPDDPRDGAAAAPTPTESAAPDHTSLDHRTLVVRRAPKVQVFLIGGAVLGLVSALIAATLGGGSEAGEVPAGVVPGSEYSFGAVFGYFLVIFGILGVALGALVWLVLDRRSRKQTYTVRAEAVEDYDDADYAVQDDDLQQWSDKWENGGRDQNAR